MNTELLDGNKGHQGETHHPTHRFRRLFLGCQWAPVNGMERMCQCHGSDQTPTLLLETMIFSHYTNITATLSSCVTLLLNLVIQMWKINLKYPDGSYPTRCYSDCENTTNRRYTFLFRLHRLGRTSLFLPYFFVMFPYPYCAFLTFH